MIDFTGRQPTSALYIYAIAGYLLFLIALSVYRSRAVKTQDDFMVAGRRVSTFFLVGSL